MDIDLSYIEDIGICPHFGKFKGIIDWWFCHEVILTAKSNEYSVCVIGELGESLESVRARAMQEFSHYAILYSQDDSTCCIEFY